jgi:hypothetical protein
MKDLPKPVNPTRSTLNAAIAEDKPELVSRLLVDYVKNSPTVEWNLLESYISVRFDQVLWTRFFKMCNYSSHVSAETVKMLASLSNLPDNGEFTELIIAGILYGRKAIIEENAFRKFVRGFLSWSDIDVHDAVAISVLDRFDVPETERFEYLADGKYLSTLSSALEAWLYSEE